MTLSRSATIADKVALAIEARPRSGRIVLDQALALAHAANRYREIHCTIYQEENESWIEIDHKDGSQTVFALEGTWPLEKPEPLASAPEAPR